MSRTATRCDSTTWQGPFIEYDRYGEPTGYRYVTCQSCGVEVLEDHRENASHREGCRHGR